MNREEYLKHDMLGLAALVESGETTPGELLDLAEMENDEATAAEIEQDIGGYAEIVERLEFRRMFNRTADGSNAFVDIQAGSGGTEAQDWAEMLLRMFERWAESSGFKIELVDRQEGEGAGIKSATCRVVGESAFGWLKSERGVHRLVRISPFDAQSRRHTAFASVDVIPEVDDDVQVEVEDKDLKIDTFRASGAGGQHVNVTDSAVRIIS